MGNVVIMIVKREGDMERLSSLLVELGIFDVSIIESEGVERSAHAMPILESLSGLFGEVFDHHRTVIAHVADDAKVDQLVSYAERYGVRFSDPEVGALMAFPCTRYVGGHRS